MTLATVLVRAGRSAEPALRTTLRNLSRIGREGELEVVVVSEGTAEPAKSPQDGNPPACAAGLREAFANASGEWVTVLDAGERLFPDWIRALRSAGDADVVYGDGAVLDPRTLRSHRFLLRPDWSPELLLGFPYVGRGAAVRRSTAAQAGGFRAGFPGAEAYDLLLRVGAETAAIRHVPEILHAALAADPAEAPSALSAVEDHLGRDLDPARAEPTPSAGFLRIRRDVRPELTTIIVPTRDRVELLRPCLESVRANTPLPHEILVIDNDSRDPETLRYLESAPAKVMRYPGEFHFSAMNNAAAAAARGRYLVFLNNDTVIHDAGWLPALLDQASQPDVGAVGAKLLFPSGTLQHVGVVIHRGARPDHPFSNRREEEIDHPWFPKVACEVAAVTGACMMVRRDLFLRLGGFDPAMRVAYNDIDLCLRLRSLGYRIVFTPFCVLTHHECATRSPLPPLGDEVLFRARWADTPLDGDPFLGPVCRALGPRLAFPGGIHVRPELDAPAPFAPRDDLRRRAADQGGG